MPLSLPLPKMTAVIDALLGAVKTEYELGATSLLKTILDGYGVTLNLTLSDHDTGEYRNLLFGDRGTPPPGLSVFVYPRTLDPNWIYTPGGMEDLLSIGVFVMWDDVQTVDDAPLSLTATPGKLQRMLCDFSEGLKVVLGPQNLQTLNGGQKTGAWVIGGGTLYNPFLQTVVPFGPMILGEREKKKQLVYYSSLIWTAKRHTTV